MAGTCTAPLKGGITYKDAYVRIEDPTVVMRRPGSEDVVKKSYALTYKILMFKDAQTVSPLPQSVRNGRQEDIDPSTLGDPWIAAYKHIQTLPWAEDWEDVLEEGQAETIAAQK